MNNATRKSLVSKLRRRTRIGIFDSGVGGLTVYKVLKKKYPSCDFIYFADTAHLPYGGKSRKTIITYTEKIVAFLLRKKADIIVCACNTASSVAVPTLSKNCPVPLYGVIDAAVQEAGSFSKVAVIGTRLTVRSGAYEKQLKKLDKNIRIKSLAAPLFVPLVEEGWADTGICSEVIEKYLKSIKAWRPDALILACTHYPVLKKRISAYFGKRVSLIDSSSITGVLSRHLSNKRSAVGRSMFFVSDDPGHFEKIASKIMKVSVERTKLCTEFL